MGPAFQGQEKIQKAQTSHRLLIELPLIKFLAVAFVLALTGFCSFKIALAQPHESCRYQVQQVLSVSASLQKISRKVELSYKRLDRLDQTRLAALKKYNIEGQRLLQKITFEEAEAARRLREANSTSTDRGEGTCASRPSCITRIITRNDIRIATARTKYARAQASRDARLKRLEDRMKTYQDKIDSAYFEIGQLKLEFEQARNFLQNCLNS